MAGSIYAEEHEAYDAERHLVLGTRDSAKVLAELEYEWFQEDEAHTAALYAGRAVLPYLLTANLRAANACYRIFTDALVRDKGDQLGGSTQQVSSTTADVRVFPSIPLLNFLGLLLLAVQRGGADLYRQLATKYAANLREVEAAWGEPLDMIAEMYFGITKPRPMNPLMDLMSGFFGGGGGAPASGGGGRKPALQSSAAMPAAEGLD